MTKEELISSGNLEAYLLGELSLAESKQVEQMVEEHPEVKDELSKIEDSMHDMAQSLAIKPPIHLKKAILSEAQKDIIQMIPAPESNSHYMMAASIAIALISVLLAFYFYSNNESLDSQLTDLQLQNETLLSENNLLKNDLEEKNRLASIASKPSYSKVVLSSTKDNSASSGVVYWDNTNGELYFILNITNAIAQNEDFQLWAIVDGKPVDAGVLNLDQKVIQEMKSLKGASAFAVTIEPKGGSENPTLSNMIMVGEVSI